MKKKIKTRKYWSISKFIRTKEDWYPSFRPGETYEGAHTLGCDALRVGMVELNWYIPNSEEEWRVHVWGGDDFGMELDQPSKEVAQELYDKIVDYTTESDLKILGFVYA